MKKIIPLFFCILSFSLFAQSGLTQKKLSRWQVGVYENIGAINNGWMYDAEYDFAITVGANAEYKICEWFSLRSGAEFFGNKYIQDNSNIVCDMPFPRYIYTNYKYLEIPFDIKFNFLAEEKVCLYFSAGIANSFRWGKSNYDFYEEDQRNYKEPFHFNKLRTNFSLGTSVRINQNLKVIFEPNFWFHIHTSYFLSSRHNFAGARIGLQYSFSER